VTDSVRGSAVEYVRDVHPDGGEGLLAIVVRTGQSSGPGCQFVTEPRHPLQVAVMRHERGHVVPPHIHLERLRTYTLTQEVLTVLAGVYRVTVYTSAGRKVQDIILAPGDASRVPLTFQLKVNFRVVLLQVIFPWRLTTKIEL
jgi:hypothetical protein